MKVNLFISRDIEEPYAEIHSDSLTYNIQKAMDILENGVYVMMKIIQF